MPALVGYMARPGRWPRCRFGRRAARGARRRHRSARDQLRRARQVGRPSWRRRSPSGILINVESFREIRACWPTFADASASGARGGARQSRLRAQVFRHEDGRRAEAVRHRRRAGAAGARARSAGCGLGFEGFHIFSRLAEPARRSDLRSANEGARAGRASWPRTRPARSTRLNLGGGFGIPYFPGEQPLDLAPIGANLARRRRARQSSALPQAQLVIELGRYLVGEAGIYVCRVVDRKVSRGRGVPGHRRRPASPPGGVRATSAR